MWAIKANEEAARGIINIFAEKNYTVSEAKEILRYVELRISNDATVQKADEPLFDYPGRTGPEIPCLKKILGKDTVIKIDGVELARLMEMVQKIQSETVRTSQRSHLEL